MTQINLFAFIEIGNSLAVLSLAISPFFRLEIEEQHPESIANAH